MANRPDDLPRRPETGDQRLQPRMRGKVEHWAMAAGHEDRVYPSGEIPVSGNVAFSTASASRASTI